MGRGGKGGLCVTRGPLGGANCDSEYFSTGISVFLMALA